MIDKVRVYSPIKTEYLSFDFKNPYACDIFITKIDGLSSAETNLASSDNGAGDGITVTNARASERNIVFYITINPDRNIEEVRRRLYDYFPNSMKITLFFTSGDVTYQIDGFTETVEADIFSSLQTMQVSVICPDPLFREVAIYDPPQRGSTMLHTHVVKTVTEMMMEQNNEVSGGLLFFVHNSTIGAAYGAKFTITLYRSIQYQEWEQDVLGVDFAIGYGTSEDIVSAGDSGTAVEEVLQMYNSKELAISIPLEEVEIEVNDKIVVNTLNGKKSVSLVRNGNVVRNLLKDVYKMEFPILHPGRNRCSILVETPRYTYLKYISIEAEFPLVHGGI